MKRNKIRLIAVDMDGTLLMSDKGLHPDTPRDIAYAASRGIHVVYCTGRDISELGPYTEQLPDMRYGICASGSIVYDFQTGKNVYRCGIPQDTIVQTIRLVGEKTGMVHFLGDGMSIVCREQMEHMEDYHMGIYKDLYRRVATPVESMLAEARNHASIAKMNIYFCSEEEREKAFAKVRHLPLSFARAEKTSLEMTAPGVSKALGLQKLAEYLGIPMDQTAGIGDSDNDRAMLCATGTAIAMGNAQREIIELCDLVTEDNDHNGAGRAIRDLCG